MEEQKEIQKHFRDSQEKYVYYLIALCVAAVGFSIHKTLDLPFHLFQIPLAISIVSWTTSIYCGLIFLEKRLDIAFTNNQYFEMLQGRDYITGNDPQKIAIGKDVFLEIMQAKSIATSKYFTHQRLFLFIGFISFLFWHILEMYKNTLCYH